MFNIISTTVLVCLLGVSTVFAQGLADLEGAADHPEFPRISGAIIAGYDCSSFDEGAYLVESASEDGKIAFEYASGEVTRILYRIPEGSSSTAAFLNYQEAFENLGEFKPIYACRRGSCDRKIGPDYIWTAENEFDTNVEDIGTYFFSYAHIQASPVYLVGEIRAETGVYIVSVYAAEAPKTNRRFTGGETVVVFQAVKTEAFKSDLEVVEADEIGSEIIKSGFVTLSGLFFETDEDVLKAESKPALDEIARFLTTSTDINVYIVGHTDNVGDVSYNQNLSRRRAVSIAASLRDEYGIDGKRIVALGAGLAAPVATNRTEEGRALNRRVELVER